MGRQVKYDGPLTETIATTIGNRIYYGRRVSEKWLIEQLDLEGVREILMLAVYKSCHEDPSMTLEDAIIPIRNATDVEHVCSTAEYYGHYVRWYLVEDVRNVE